MVLELSTKWLNFIVEQPETGMGYHVVSIILKNGEKFDRVVITDGKITQIYEEKKIPFTVEDIKEIIVTHDKWKFN